LSLCFCFCFCFCFWDSRVFLCSPGLPATHYIPIFNSQYYCLSLPNAGSTGLWHHTQLYLEFYTYFPMCGSPPSPRHGELRSNWYEL
jgi:hypothetical protein